MIDNINKIDYFKTEIGYIKNSEYIDDFKKLIELLPDYFFKVAASSTGKYHPAFSLGDGGLLRHTKAAVRIAYELLNDPCIGDKYTSREKDLFLIALTMHDGVKHGIPEEKYTRADHPLLASNLIKEHRKELKMSQAELAERVNVSNNHISSIETGKQIPSLTTFVKICEQLDTTPDFLLLGSLHTDNLPKNIYDSLALCNKKDLPLIQDIVENFVSKRE